MRTKIGLRTNKKSVISDEQTDKNLISLYQLNVSKYRGVEKSNEIVKVV